MIFLPGKLFMIIIVDGSKSGAASHWKLEKRSCSGHRVTSWKASHSELSRTPLKSSKFSGREFITAAQEKPLPARTTKEVDPDTEPACHQFASPLPGSRTSQPKAYHTGPCSKGGMR